MLEILLVILFTVWILLTVALLVIDFAMFIDQNWHTDGRQ